MARHEIEDKASNFVVREDLLQLLLEAYEPPPRPVHLVYARQSRLPLKLRALIDFVVPRLRGRLTAAAL